MMKARVGSIRRPPGGFTLLELTVAMTLSAILAAAVVSAFSTGLQIWERVQQDSDAAQEAAALLERVSADLRGAWLGPGAKAGLFTLEQETAKREEASPALSFTTLLPGREAAEVASFTQISYRLDPDRGILWRGEAPAPSDKAAESEEPVELEEEEVAENVRQFAVRCWDGEQWQDQWPAPQQAKEKAEEEAPTLPQIVEITLELISSAGNPRLIRAAVPIEMAHP